MLLWLFWLVHSPLIEKLDPACPHGAPLLASPLPFSRLPMPLFDCNARMRDVRERPAQVCISAGIRNLEKHTRWDLEDATENLAVSAGPGTDNLRLA